MLRANRGLTVATVVTLVLVPVLYEIFVVDLKIVKWKALDADLTAHHPASSG